MSVEGPSGLGKTRLLRALAQLDAPLGGTITMVGVSEARDIALYRVGLCSRTQLNSKEYS